MDAHQKQMLRLLHK